MSKLNLVDYASKGSRYIITAQEFDQLMNLIITSNNIHDDSVKFIGDLSTLLTADKTTLVNGINELYTWLNNLDKDSDGNFIVDDSEKLGGNDASYYTNSLNINFDDTIAKLGKINVQDALDKLKYLIDSLTTDDVRETYERVFVTPAQKVKLDSLPQASNIIQTDGSVPMDSYYSPENPQDIVTKRFLEEVANFTSGVDTSAFVSKAEFSGEMDKASYTKEIFNSNVNSPINAIRKAPQEVVKIEGQTLNNLLGDDGDCENVSDWESYQCLAVLDNTTKVFGSNSIKITLNPTFVASSLHKKNLLNLMPQGKYWFASACYKNGTASTGIRLVLNCDGDKTLSTPCVINDVWSRVGIKLHPTDYDISTYIYLENQLYGTEGEYAYVDGVALYEITQEEYDNLTVNELLEKYPYVNSMQSVINPIITYTGKNIAKLDDTTFRFMSPVSEITYTYVESGVRLERTIDQDEGAYIQFDIKAKCNTTYTMSGKFINHNPIGKSYIDINSTDFTGIHNFLVSTLSPTSDSSGSFSKTFTTFGNTNKLTISFYIQYPDDDLTSGKLDIEYYDIQIEENDIATVDESYIERQKQITGTFRGCGSVRDTIDCNYNLTKKMSDVINLWEHPTIQLNNTFTKTYKFEFTNFHSTYGLKNQGINSKNGVISGFVSPKTTDDGDYRQWYLGFTQLYMFAEKTVIDAQAGATTVDKFKTYLQAENIQGTFELATYTTTPLNVTQDEKTMLLEEGSYIYQSGDNAVTPITTVKCATDVASQMALVSQNNAQYEVRITNNTNDIITNTNDIITNTNDIITNTNDITTLQSQMNDRDLITYNGLSKLDITDESFTGLNGEDSIKLIIDNMASYSTLLFTTDSSTTIFNSAVLPVSYVFGSLRITKLNSTSRTMLEYFSNSFSKEWIGVFYGSEVAGSRWKGWKEVGNQGDITTLQNDMAKRKMQTLNSLTDIGLTDSDFVSYTTGQSKAGISTIVDNMPYPSILSFYVYSAYPNLLRVIDPFYELYSTNNNHSFELTIIKTDSYKATVTANSKTTGEIYSKDCAMFYGTYSNDNTNGFFTGWNEIVSKTEFNTIGQRRERIFSSTISPIEIPLGSTPYQFNYADLVIYHALELDVSTSSTDYLGTHHKIRFGIDYTGYVMLSSLGFIGVSGGSINAYTFNVSLDIGRTYIKFDSGTKRQVGELFSAGQNLYVYEIWGLRNM